MAELHSYHYLDSSKTFGDTMRDKGQSHWKDVTLCPGNAGSWTNPDLKIDRLSLHTDEDNSVDQLKSLSQLCNASSHTCLTMDGVVEQGLSPLASLLDASRSINLKLMELTLRGNYKSVVPYSYDEQLTEDSVFKEFLETQHSTLQILAISCFRLSCMHLSHIGKVLESSVSKLQELLLSETEIGDPEVKLLAEAMKTSHTNTLRSLSLHFNRIGDEGVRSIAVALENPHSQLEELDLLTNNIGNEGAKWLAVSLQSNTRLRKLFLGRNHIGDEGAKCIGEVLKSANTRLEVLSLRENEITDEGARCIAKYMNGVLKELDLSRNDGIKEIGTIAIAKSLNQHNSLERLNLTNCRGGNGVKHMAETLKDPRCRLKKLSIDAPTENDVSAIVESLQTCTLESLSLYSYQKDYLQEDAATKKLLSTLDSCYWSFIRYMYIEGSSSRPQVAKTIGSLISRNKAIFDGQLSDLERVNPDTAKLFVCGHSTSTVAKQKIINSILQQPFRPFGKKKTTMDGLMDLRLTSLNECGNLKKLLLVDVQHTDGYFPFFSARPRHSLFLVVCSIPLIDGQSGILVELDYWLKSIRLSSTYHGPNPKVMLCLDFPKEYCSKPSLKGKKTTAAMASLKETARIRVQILIKKFEQVIDFGASNDGNDNLFVTIEGNSSGVEKIKDRMQTLFQELQTDEFLMPKICLDLLHLLQQLWKNQQHSFPAMAFDQLVSQFQAKHGSLQISDLNIQTALQLLDARGYVVYQPPTGIVVLALEFFAHLARSLEGVTDAYMRIEDIAVKLKDERNVQADLVDKLIHCLRNAGIICPKDKEWKGDLSNKPNEFFLPIAISKPIAWDEDKGVFWGRRLECADKETMAIPQHLFRKLQSRQSLCNMGSTWIQLIENKIQIIVRIDSREEGQRWDNKQWIDIMFRVPEEQIHDLNQHVILARIINQIYDICYADSVCPTVELHEKVIGSGAVKTLDLLDIDTELLSVIMAELSEYGVKYTHNWQNGRSAELKALLSPIEINVHLLNISNEVIKEFELDTEIAITECISRSHGSRIIPAAFFQLGKIVDQLWGVSRLERLVNQRFDNIDKSHEEIKMSIEELKMSMEDKLGKLEKDAQVWSSKMTSKMLNIMNLVDERFPKFPCLKGTHEFVIKLSALFEKQVVLHFMCEWEMGAHAVDDAKAKGFEFKLTRQWAVKAAPVLVPALQILALATKMAAAGLTTGACPLPLFSGSTVIQKAILPEILKEFSSGLETELKKDWDARPDPLVLKEFLQHTLQGKRIPLQNFGLRRMHTPKGIRYLCGSHSKPFEPTANQDLHL